MKSPDNRRDRTWLVFLLIFVLLAAGILAGGYFMYQNYEQDFRAKAERQLSAIAELKVNQLVQYRKERFGDASVLFKNPAFSNLVRRLFENTNDGDANRKVHTWLGKYISDNQYDHAILLDTRGVIRMSLPDTAAPVGAVIEKRASEVLRGGKVLFQDFYRNEHDQKIYLAILVPVLDDSDRTRQLGVVVIRINPSIYLYPLIQTWPVPSRSSEALLVRREGNDVLFLNELRFHENAALNLRLPMSNESLPAVKAALGHEGIVEGTDYRGVQVVAAVRNVPNSPWFLVAREDRSEVDETMRIRLMLVAMLVAAFIIAAGSGVGLIWRYQRSRFYRQSYESAVRLQESELRLRRAVSNAPLPVMIHAEDGEVVMINDAWTEITGYTHQDIPTTAAWTEKACGERMKLVQEDINRLYGLTEKIYDGDYEVTTKSRDKRTWEFMSAPLGVLPDGRRMVISMAVDITKRRRDESDLRRLYEVSERSRSALLSILEDQKRAEGSLRESELRFRLLFDKAPLGYQSLNADGHFIDVNQEWLDTLGYERDEVIGHWFGDYLAPEYQDAFCTQFPIYKAQGKLHAEFEVLCKNGRTRFIAFDGRIGTDLNGEFKQTHCILKDITEQRKAELEILKLNAELEQRVLERTAQLTSANEELEAFCYSVSHDLRAPLRAIDGFSRILLEDYSKRLDGEGRRLLSVVSANANKMAELITDLLDLSRVGRNEMNFTRVDMSDLANSVFHELASPDIQQKFSFLIAQLPDAHCDRSLMRQVWRNVISNAVKFTMPKDVRSIEIGGRTDEGMNVYFIKDSGVGFNPVYAHKLFGVFQRLHKAEEFEGTGVGLAIVQRIIHRHGGKVWAEGKVGAGATFWFSLPSKE